MEELSVVDQKLMSLMKALAHVADQQNRMSAVVDSLSEVVATLLYCLEKDKLSNDFFQQALPEVQGQRMDAVLSQLFKSGAAVQLTEVEKGASVLTSGYTGDDKTTARRIFTVNDGETSAFLGKHIGDKVKLAEDAAEVFEILAVYTAAQQQVSQ